MIITYKFCGKKEIAAKLSRKIKKIEYDCRYAAKGGSAELTELMTGSHSQICTI